MNNIMPIGTVVLLKGMEKRFMIYGVKQSPADSNEVFDYVGCPFPEGNIGPEYNILFNQDQIQNIFFIGFQDYEALLFKKTLNEELSKQNSEAKEENK